MFALFSDKLNSFIIEVHVWNASRTLSGTARRTLPMSVSMLKATDHESFKKKTPKKAAEIRVTDLKQCKKRLVFSCFFARCAVWMFVQTGLSKLHEHRCQGATEQSLNRSTAVILTQEAEPLERVGYIYFADHSAGSYLGWPAVEWCPASDYDPRFRPWSFGVGKAGFSRMRSEGSRFIWGSGGEAVFAESCVYVRNRSQPFAVVR